MERESAMRQRRGDPVPLVSVIVVVYRAAAELPAVLESIFRCKDEDLELIVIDGGSDDDTVPYLEAQGDRIDYWLSKPDHGIYDAMNRAVSEARGTFFLHLNSGDRLIRVPKEELLQAKDEGIDVAAFRVSIDGRREFRPSVGGLLRFTNTLHHQGSFFRREAFLAYDLRYRVFADFDVNQRLALAGARMRVFNTTVAFHANDGISNQNSKHIEAEFFSIIEKNHGRWPLPLAKVIRKWQGLMIMLGR